MPGLAAVSQWLRLDWVLLVMAGWLVVGVAGVFALHRFALVSRVLFPVGGALGLALFGLALGALLGTPEVAVLPIGLPALPFHLRLDSLSAFFLMVIGACSAGISAFAAGYFRKGEGTPPGLLCLEYHVFLASMVRRHPGRRCLCLHGDVGDDGLVVVLPRHRQPPHPRGAQRRQSLHRDGPRRRDRGAAVLRRAAGQHRRLHVCRHARAEPRPLLGVRRLPAGGVRLRRQGRRSAAARLAAGGAPGSTFTGLGLDERRDAQHRHLRRPARVARLAAAAAVVVGRAVAGHRPRNRPVRRRVRFGADRHEAAAGLFLDREHGPALRRHGARADLLRVTA